MQRSFAAAFSTACEVIELASDAPCRAPCARLLITAGARHARTDSTTPPSKSAASTTRGAFHRRVLPTARFREPRGNPPPISRLCHRRVGFRRAFTSRRSRVGRLDPPSSSRALHSRARRATRRSSTSAIESRSTSTTADRSNPAHRHEVALVDSAFLAGGRAPCGAQPAKWSRARGRTAFARSAPFRAIARPESFAPTRSPWTPRVASSTRTGGWSASCSHRDPRTGAVRREGPARSLSRHRPQGRLTHPPAKKSAIRCTRGAFHRRMVPRRGWPLSPTTCPQAVECLARRLFDPHRRGAPDEHVRVGKLEPPKPPDR
jgi:hypothetical protein